MTTITKSTPILTDFNDFFESKVGSVEIQEKLSEYELEALSACKNHKNTSIITEDEADFPEGQSATSTVNLNGILLTANPTFLALSGYEKNEIIGVSNFILRHPDMPKAALNSMVQSLMKTGEWSGCVKYLRKDGGFYWANTSIAPLMCCDKHVGYIGTQTKCTQSKIKSYANLYKQIHQTEII